MKDEQGRVGAGDMSYRDCLACKAAGTKPQRGTGARVVYDPRVLMPGPPTLEGHRLGAALVAGRAYNFGLKEQMEDYRLTREEVLVCCWWAGTYGPRRLKKAFGAWAEKAGWHFWYGCIRIPDPPTAPGAPGEAG